MTVLALLIVVAFVVVGWRAVVEVRRGKQRERAGRLKRLARLRSLVPEFLPDEVERRGDRVFIDRLIERRLALR